jgi:fluoride exporter
VFVGGAIGSLARWGVAAALPVGPGAFPLATFLVNVTGAFGLAAAAVILTERLPTSGLSRSLVGNGFFGAYTTFSIVALEGVRLIDGGHVAMALAYWVATLIAGQAAGLYGMWIARLRPPIGRRRT